MRWVWPCGKYQTRKRSYHAPFLKVVGRDRYKVPARVRRYGCIEKCVIPKAEHLIYVDMGGWTEINCPAEEVEE